MSTRQRAAAHLTFSYLLLGPPPTFGTFGSVFIALVEFGRQLFSSLTSGGGDDQFGRFAAKDAELAAIQIDGLSPNLPIWRFGRK